MNTFLSSSFRTLAVALVVATSFSTAAVARSGAPAGATFDNCSWDRPGVDPFMGDVVAAVDRYQDLAPEVRERLKARMVKREYDDVVSIRRDSITGRAKARYGSTIRDMHFGAAKVCHSVSRAAWSAQMQERGLVYCEGGQCILVPTVCRNVSRIARAEVAPEHAEGDVPEIEAPPVAALEVLPTPLPVDLAAPAPFAAPGAPGAETPPDQYAQGGSGGGAGSVGGAHGSFASGSGGGSSGATIASSGGKGDVGSPPTGLEVAPPITPVPEPETWGLMIGGLAALAAYRRRRQARLRARSL